MSATIREHNRPDGEPPYALQNPRSEGHVKWICSHDADGRLVSVFSNDDPDFEETASVPRRIVTVHETLDEVKQTRDVLVDDGWVPVVLPDIQFTDSDGNVVKDRKPLSRKERRFLARQLKRSSNFQKNLVGEK